MKKGIVFLLLALSVIAQARTVTLPRRSNNTVYIMDASTLLQAGDTVLLEGDYTSIKLLKVQGTKEAPIIFRNKGLVTIGGYVPYTWVINGSYFKILGNGDPAFKYGIQLGKNRDSIYGSFGLAFGDSKGVEVAFCEFQFLSSGILQNPMAGQLMADCYYHDNYLHDFDNPKARGRSEGFYLGQTKTSTTRFENCRIENNLIENVSGDGIQVSRGTFIVKGNTVRNYAKARLAMQRAGIIVGGEATADIIDNVLQGGGGVGLQIFGCGKMEVAGNTFKDIDVQLLPKEDIVYINGKTATPDNPLEINFHNNTFINVAPNRKVIYNGTFEEKTSGITYKKNKGLSSDKINLSKKDKWKD